MVLLTCNHKKKSFRCSNEVALQVFHFVNTHSVKSVRIRSIFWPVFAGIRTDQEVLQRKYSYSIRMRKNTDLEKLRIRTIFYNNRGTQDFVWSVYFHVQTRIGNMQITYINGYAEEMYTGLYTRCKFTCRLIYENLLTKHSHVFLNILGRDIL